MQFVLVAVIRVHLSILRIRQKGGNGVAGNEIKQAEYCRPLDFVQASKWDANSWTGPCDAHYSGNSL